MAKVSLSFSGVHKKCEKISTDDSFGLFLAAEAKRGMSPYVPFRNGYLDASATVTPFEVTYPVEHAARVYYGDGLRISRERHALATSHWDEAYMSAHGADLVAAGTRYLKRQS